MRNDQDVRTCVSLRLGRLYETSPLVFRVVAGKRKMYTGPCVIMCAFLGDEQNFFMNVSQNIVFS